MCLIHSLKNNQSSKIINKNYNEEQLLWQALKKSSAKITFDEDIPVENSCIWEPPKIVH